MESFNIKIETQKSERAFIKSLINDKIEFQKGLMISDSDEDLSIIGSTFSFLPACHLMYELCTEIAKMKANFIFSTYNEDRVFDFKSKTEFINYMYCKWEKKLDGVAEQLGVFLVLPVNAYKTQRRLRKKYFTKLRSIK